jgi:hypothetical protein
MEGAMAWKREIMVYCKTCKEEIPESTTEFRDIEEGQYGEDILTFKCPKCKKIQKSKRFG